MKPCFEFDPVQQPEKRNISFASRKLALLSSFKLKKEVVPAETIIFTHAPKTGGTNLCFMTEALSKVRENFKVTRFAVPRIPNYSPGVTYVGWIGGFESALNTLGKDKHYCDGMNFISGHFPFGLHGLIENKAKYITLIRNPLERSISTTNFDYQRGYVSSEKVLDYLFESEIDNPQTRMLAGREFMTGDCNEFTFEQAMKNIKEHFLLVGVTEETNEFMQALAAIQKWDTFALPRAQVTGKKAIVEISTDLEEKLYNKHRYDMKLYQEVKALWKEWKEVYIDSEYAPSIKKSENIICVTSDFASTKEPLLLSYKQIEEYNTGVDENDLIETSQVHDKAIVSQEGNLMRPNPSFTPYMQSIDRKIDAGIQMGVISESTEKDKSIKLC